MRRFLLWCAIVLAAAYAVGVPLFMLSDDDAIPEGADAVVVLAGPDNLLPAGQTLVNGGIAPTLVVSATRSGRGDRRVRLCQAEPEGVECVYPGPFSTPGEAQAISALAKSRGWDTVVLVTPDYERYVAQRVFRRCGDFRVAEHGVDQPWWRDVVGIPLEWVKFAIAETVRRGC